MVNSKSNKIQKVLKNNYKKLLTLAAITRTNSGARFKTDAKNCTKFDFNTRTEKNSTDITMIIIIY